MYYCNECNLNSISHEKKIEQLRKKELKNPDTKPKKEYSSIYIGVTKDKNKWRARKKLDGKNIIDKGNFETEIEAAIAINKAIYHYNDLQKTNHKLLDIYTENNILITYDYTCCNENIEEPNFKCITCNITLKTQCTYDKHLKSKNHLKNEQFVPSNSDENMRCEICDIEFKLKAIFDKHFETAKHIDNVRILKNKNEKLELLEFRKASTDYIYKIENYDILLDKDVYLYIVNNNITISMKNKYPFLTYKNIKCLLHRFVFYHMRNKEESYEFPVIDHRDHNKCNAKLENLLECTSSINNKNKSKSANASSIYPNVRRSNSGKYTLNLVTASKGNYTFTHEKESWAAYYRDLLIKDLGLNHEYKLIGIQEPEGFILPSTHKHKIIYNMNNPKVYNLKYNNIQVTSHIIRNNNGIAIINIHDKYDVKIAETMVDDDVYFDLVQYKWTFMNYKNCKDKQQYDEDNILRKGSCIYIYSKLTGRNPIGLSRYIMNCTELKKVVDHNNSNTLDNRKQNLEVVSKRQNSHNKLSAKNSSSQYVGVFKTHDGYYVATLTIDGVRVLNKYYHTEGEAVFHRDIVAKYYNENHDARFKLNIQ